jgi:steroid delta-isomerase-like uncharacterized protein
MNRQEQNKATVQQWVEAGWNQGKVEIFDQLYAPGYTLHDPTAPNLQGGAAFKAFVGQFRSAMPDLHFRVDEMVAEQDKVVWRFTATGTHRGTLMGIPASGKPIHISGMVCSRFEEGKWVEDYTNWDTLGMLQQIGAIPALA